MKARFATLMIAAGVTGLVPTASTRAADYGATLQADAARIDADITQLQADQQKVRQLVVPDRTALAAAQKQYDTDAAPYLTKLKADQQQFDDMVQSRRQAIKASREQGESTLKAMETKLTADRQRAKKDKSLVAQIPQQETELKNSREKLKQDLKALEEKLTADTDAGKQSLEAERQSMNAALKPDSDALSKAKQQLQSDLAWETKVSADQAALQADEQKFQQDKQAAGQ